MTRTALHTNLLAAAAAAAAAVAAAWLPVAARAADDTGCAILAQAAAAGLSARFQADDQTIKQPRSVTTLSCLDNFFNGVGLNVLTNLLDPTSLLSSVEGKICAYATSAWQNAIGSAQCGLTVTGFNVGFGGLGGGSFCPKLSFGGGGAALGSIGTSLGGGQSGLFISGSGLAPTGYGSALPNGVNY